MNKLADQLSGIYDQTCDQAWAQTNESVQYQAWDYVYVQVWETADSTVERVIVDHVWSLMQ